MNEEKKRRLGKFKISTGMLLDDLATAVQVFKMLEIVPMRAECMFHLESVEYIAFSNRFEEISYLDEPPEYKLKITKSEAGNVELVEVVAL